MEVSFSDMQVTSEMPVCGEEISVYVCVCMHKHLKEDFFWLFIYFIAGCLLSQ